ncbi:MAG: glutathione S-transferase family protein [Rhodospirillaceae bacterium]|jgi:glutathione S-transferase|nr:glutathione S-transferase family protein [Rhodospirillaceae bacterium]MBT7956642.1 glutathione S-transferase family protein [Rhodospirillaceae bacterium]
MSNEYRIFGTEMSPYSVKMRSYFRYKNIPHKWLQRFQHEEEYQKLTRLPLIPLVVAPDGKTLQDTTPVIEKMELVFPEPSVHPEDPTLAFLSALVEEYGDEWGMKLMFHHRWVSKADKLAGSHILAREILPYGESAEIDELAEKILERMAGRLILVGSNAETAPLLSNYLNRLLEILEPHLENRLYLFGDRPAFADFGLGLQVYEMALDPTAGSLIRAVMPNILQWAYRMTSPRNDGPFEDWPSLQPTLEPLLSDVGTYFLPWSTANAEAIIAEEDNFSVELNGETYTQSSQRYHARSLEKLRDRYAAAADNSALNQILADTGCLAYLH